MKVKEFDEYKIRLEISISEHIYNVRFCNYQENENDDDNNLDMKKHFGHLKSLSDFSLFPNMNYLIKTFKLSEEDKLIAFIELLLKELILFDRENIDSSFENALMQN